MGISSKGPSGIPPTMHFPYSQFIRFSGRTLLPLGSSKILPTPQIRGPLCQPVTAPEAGFCGHTFGKNFREASLVSLEDTASEKMPCVSVSYKRISVLCLDPPYPAQGLQKGGGGGTTHPILVTGAAALRQPTGKGTPPPWPWRDSGPSHTEL